MKSSRFVFLCERWSTNKQLLPIPDHGQQRQQLRRLLENVHICMARGMRERGVRPPLQLGCWEARHGHAREIDMKQFFTTQLGAEEAERRRERKQNTKGSPLKLPSKVIHASMTDAVVYCGCSNSSVCTVALASKEVKRLTAHQGPVACVASTASFLATGSWDKSVKAWDFAHDAPLDLHGHSDFVKCLACFRWRGRTLIVSGSSDTTLMIWDATQETPLQTLRGHIRPVNALCAIVADDAVTLWSGASDRELRQWTFDGQTASQVGHALLVHETSINSIRVTDEDMWTTSNDRYARRTNLTTLVCDTGLLHPDFVKDAIVHGAWVITACSDHAIRVWDVAAETILHVFDGHYDEVTSLHVYQDTLVSTSLDATLRQWPLRAEAWKEVESQPIVLTTQEEEDELAELMD